MLGPKKKKNNGNLTGTDRKERQLIQVKMDNADPQGTRDAQLAIKRGKTSNAHLPDHIKSQGSGLAMQTHNTSVGSEAARGDQTTSAQVAPNPGDTGNAKMEAAQEKKNKANRRKSVLPATSIVAKSK